MTVKVSVIVPTYAPGKRIDRLVRSLETQTMPTSEFEVLFVDDGSPGQETWERLKAIRDAHDNVRIERIENSGWPSRPRNVGLDLARGEYVLFMDHDDELYPRALEAGYAFAAGAGADVLNGKEMRTDQSKWAMEVYAANAENVVDRDDFHPLLPTNPHKLFRRSMLIENSIRFPEGRRVLWEDVFFGLDVARHAKVVSVMADTPFYHWVRGGKTASSSYASDRAEYWRWVGEIVRQTNEKLAGPRLRGQWRLMLLHQYRSRVLTQLSPKLFRAPAEEVELVRATVEDLLRDHIPAELDAYLTPTQLGRAVLVRAGRWDLLEKLVAVDAAIVGLSATTSVEWQQGTLRVTAESRWRTASGTPLAIRRDGDRIVRDLPSDVAAALPDAAIDMTAAIDRAKATVAVRDRATAVVWALPTRYRQRIDIIDDRPELVLVADAVLDPATAAFGRALEAGTWDLSVRNALLGAVNQRGLRTTTSSRNAVLEGHVYIAYRNSSGMLALDVDQTNRSLPGSAKLDPQAATTTVTPGRRSIRTLRRRMWLIDVQVPFTGVATNGPTTVDGTARAGSSPPQPARIVADDHGVRVETRVEQRPGTHPLVLHFHGRDLDSRIDLTVNAAGQVRLARRNG